jgi:hypothetical protein
MPRLQDLIFFVVLVTFFVFPLINIMPAIVTNVYHGGPDVLGLLLASSGAGALVGTIFVVPIAQSLRRTGRTLALSVVWMGVWNIIFSYTTSLPLGMGALFLSSIAAEVVMTMGLGLTQFLAPEHMRARLVTFFLMVSFGMQPFASLLIGFSAQQLTAPIAIRLNGLLLLAGTVILVGLRPKLRAWEVDSPSQPAASAAVNEPLAAQPVPVDY